MHAARERRCTPLTGTFWLFLVCFYCAPVMSEDVASPGIRAALSQNALTYFKTQITPEFINTLVANITIPPINGTQYDVSYFLSDMRLGNVSFTSDNISIVPQKGVAFRISGATAGITLKWKVELIISDSGTASIDVGDTQFDMELDIGENNGHLTLALSSLSLKLGKLDIHLQGGATWILNFFIDVFSGLIKSQVESSATAAIQGAVQQLNQRLADMPMTFDFPAPLNGVIVDYSVVNPPTFTSEYLAFDFKGQGRLSDGSDLPPFAPDPLPAAQAAHSMAEVIVGEYTLQTLAWAAQKSGVLRLVVTPDEIPTWSPVKLNTYYWQYIIPKLYHMYPNDDMNVVLAITETPIVSINGSTKTQGVYFNATGDMTMNVLTKNGTVAVFVLQINALIELTLSVTPTVVHGKIDFGKFTAGIVNSTIGTFDVSVVNFFLDLLFNSVVAQAVNLYLSTEGIPLPTIQGVALQSPNLAFYDRYLSFTTDIQLVPSLLSKLIS